MTWREDIEAEWWLTAIEAQQQTVSGRLEMVDVTGTVHSSLDVESVSVDFRGEMAEQWSCEITVTDPALTPTKAADVLDSRSGLRARVWWRLAVDLTPDPENPGLYLSPSGDTVSPDGTGLLLTPDPENPGLYLLPARAWVEVPIGTYFLEDPRIHDNGRALSITVSGRDSIVIAKRSGYGSQVLDVSGLTVTDALVSLFQTLSPGVPVRIAQTTQTVPGAVGSGTVQLGLGQTTPSEDWTALADSAGWVVRTDREGTIVAGPPPSPRTIRAHWQEGPDCPVTEVTREVAQSRIRNRVLVRSTARDLTEPVWAMVEDTDDASPTYVGGPFGVRQETIESDAVDTEAGCLAMARMHYGRLNHPTETVSVTVPQRPDLGYRDRIALRRERAGVGGIHLVSGWSLRMSAGAPALMTVDMMTRAVDE